MGLLRPCGLRVGGFEAVRAGCPQRVGGFIDVLRPCSWLPGFMGVLRPCGLAARSELEALWGC